MNSNPYLSIVAVSRNDDHGGDPLIRTQIFINSLAAQCEKYNLNAELIIVDWNPVKDRPGLGVVLTLPSSSSLLKATIVTVPAELHSHFKSSESLHLFQMIGKNVGIRRASGDFILATNIDVLFSNELMEFIALRKLEINKIYRVDRFDIENGLMQDSTLYDCMNYAWAHPVRKNLRFDPQWIKDCYSENSSGYVIFLPPQDQEKLEHLKEHALSEHSVWSYCPPLSEDMSYVHTNACGDFTLMSKEGWDIIGGYPEFEGYSFNIDSLGLLAAHYGGFQEISLLPPCVCFHIEHSLGSGWTPEGEKLLFKRMREKGITSPEWPFLISYVRHMQRAGTPIKFNDDGWGLKHFKLSQTSFGDTYNDSGENECRESLRGAYKVSAIKPQYDLDRIALIHERAIHDKKIEEIQERWMGLHGGEPALFRAQLFFPDDRGNFCEESSFIFNELRGFKGMLTFALTEFRGEHPLRFDPLSSPGIVLIKSFAIINPNGYKVLVKAQGSKLSKFLQCDGDDINSSSSNGAMIFFSCGVDPRILIKTNDINYFGPAIVMIEIEYPVLVD